MKTLSVTLIVKNEEKNLERLLPSLTFADEIIVVDTGSDDDTCIVTKKYTDKLFSFLWCDDFSAARNFAISKAVGEYFMWLDADDIIPPETEEAVFLWKNNNSAADTVMAKYCCSAENGEPTFWFYRERILKNDPRAVFRGAVHEAIAPFGQIEYADFIVYHSPSKAHTARNVAIYRTLLQKGHKFNPRETYYFARELYYFGLYDEALTYVDEFLAGNGWYVDKISAGILKARLLLLKRDNAGAKKSLLETFFEAAPVPEACCLLGEIYFAEENFRAAAYWYEAALRCRNNEGFVNEDYAEFIPYVQLSVIMYKSGDFKKAKFWHEKAALLKPENPYVLNNNKYFC